MRVDLKGRIRNTKLADRHGLHPLFEAIINSVDAIQDGGVDRGEIRVRIHRDLSLFTPDAHGKTIPDVSGFSIVDNGIGFTDEQYESFETVDTTIKAPRGGKGIGRILWLRAFEYATVDSIYCQDDNLWRRRFDFRPTDNGIEKHELERMSRCDGRSNETIVSLIGYNRRYQQATPKSAKSIALRIVEHCLKLFVMEAMPRVRLEDHNMQYAVDLRDLYLDVYQPQAETREFAVGGQTFLLTDVFLAPEAELAHQLHFCAHERVVTSLGLGSRIAHLPAILRTEDGRPAVYSAYISSPLLDERVDQERTQFTLDRKGELSLAGAPTWEELVDKAVESVADRLAPITAEARRESVARVRQYVAEKAPRYRPLLEHRRLDIEELPSELSEQKLDLELHRILSGWKAELRARTQQLDDQANEDSISDSFYRERFSALVDELQEATVAELAEYVVHRRVILDLLRRMLGRQNDGKFSKEDALHDVLFPRRNTTDTVNYDDHNLWILDERLAYHYYLASDVPLKDQSGPIASESKRRPDLIIYNRALAFSEGRGSVSAVVIVEFKRPERDDYDDDSSPIRQVLDYVRDLREGKARAEDGSTIELPPNIPFYCFVVATITQRLKHEAENVLGYTPAPDHAGYFSFNPNLKAYIEVLSYKKVLDDATKRNQIFFDKLQIPLP